jgi:threonine synthase
MVAVQAEGCAPIVRAFEQGLARAPRWEDAHTVAAGIRVPAAIGDALILQAVRASDGFAIAVSDEAILRARADAARQDGVMLSPEGAATLAAYLAALERGLVAPDERAVLFNCGNGLKYPMPPAERRLDLREPIEYASLVDRRPGAGGTAASGTGPA